MVCSPLSSLETHLQSRAAHVAPISGRELPVLGELGERRAASFPESQPRIGCVGPGPGEVEPARSRRLRAPARRRASPPPRRRCCPEGWRRQGVLTDRGIDRSCSSGSTGRAPVPWASSAAFLSQETRKKSVSGICTVLNPECLAISSDCLLLG